MKIIFMLSLLLTTACSTVTVTVNSVKNQQVDGSKPLYFPASQKTVDIEKLRKQCMIGAVIAKKSVVNSCGNSCYFVVVKGNSGESMSAVSTTVNPLNGQKNILSSQTTDRNMVVTAYANQNMNDIVWEANLDSSGSSKNILSVAKEMCAGAFEVFPEEVTGREISIFSNE